MSMQGLLKNLDREFYKKAAGNGGAIRFLAVQAADAGVAPEGAEWEARRKGFRQRFDVERRGGGRYAEMVDQHAWNTYALEKALADCGIKTRGVESATVEKVYATTTSQVLFPTYVESQVVAGILDTSLVPVMVAEEVEVNAHVAEHTAMTESAADRQTSKTNQGARGATVKISTGDRTINLAKYMAQLDVTYEAIRLQRLNIISLFLQRLGQQLANDETDDAIQVAIAGDGNSGSAVVDTDAEASGTLDYDELTRLFLAFPNGYEMRVAIANDTQLRTILNMAEFKDPVAGFNFQRTGMLVDPMGAMWKRWTSTGASAFSTDRILALDNRRAMIQYTEGGLMTETDKLIDRQFEATVVSKWTGFGKLDYSATQCLDITT